MNEFSWLKNLNSVGSLAYKSPCIYRLYDLLLKIIQLEREIGCQQSDLTEVENGGQMARLVSFIGIMQTKFTKFPYFMYYLQLYTRLVLVVFEKM